MNRAAGSKVLEAELKTSMRQALERIYQAAVAAASPASILERRIKIAGDRLVIETARERRRFPLTGRVFLVGVGKGVDLSAPFWDRLLGRRLVKGRLLVRDRLFHGRLKRIAIAVAGHPLPDERGVAGTRACLQMLGQAGRDDSVIFFLMGGASSLMVAPAGGITLADKRAVTLALLRSGMSIAEMNCVRKHLSLVKAGGLLRAAYPARVLTLAISDVVGDDPAVIGSAPSFPDPTTFAEAWKILQRYKLMPTIPKAVKSHLLRGIQGELPETLKPGSSLARRSSYYVVLASNRDSLAAAKRRAESLGFPATILTAELSGDARTRAREVCSKLKSASSGKNSGAGPRCFLLGGETTVSVRGQGLGGRNQEFALASALALRGYRELHLLCAASDGSDGPTDAAGAFVDGDTVARARRAELDPRRALDHNDSHPFFERLGDLFRPGPTGTNVLDFVIALTDGG
jgi:glycerate 2-kinase